MKGFIYWLFGLKADVDYKFRNFGSACYNRPPVVEKRTKTGRLLQLFMVST